MKKQILPIFASIALAGSSSHAAVILGSDFSGVSKSGTTASSITWDTVAGINSPANSLTFGGDAAGFHDARAGQLDVNANIGNGDTWSTSFDLVLDAGTSSINLTSFDLVIDLTNASGSDQGNTTQKDGIWTVDIVGSGTYTQSASTTITNYTSVIGQAVPVDLTGLPSLTDAETYTFTFSVIQDDGTFGHHVSVDSLSLTGDITPVPEPSAALLIGFGGVALLLRRRRA